MIRSKMVRVSIRLLVIDYESLLTIGESKIGKVTKYGDTNRRCDWIWQHWEEVLLANLTFTDGAIGMVGDSTCILREHHTGIIGTKGSLLMSGEHDQTVLRLHLEGEPKEQLIPAIDSKRPSGGLDHFLECIRMGKLSPNSISDARHSLAVALAMQESARSGQVVSID